MTAEITLQKRVKQIKSPSKSKIQKWLMPILKYLPDTALTICMVDEIEIANLNAAYRGKNKPTNVLSFPFDPVPGVLENYLGDIVICAAVVAKEALLQHKSLDSHWAHMVIHGVLHLLGYDHLKIKDAVVMENLETRIMLSLGFEDPYENM